MDGRLPLDSETRVQSRDRKLEARERAIAERQGRTHRDCPCNICLGLNHSRRSHGAIAYHLTTYGRHPYHRGSTAGCPSDESDLEWDTSIREGFGMRREGFLAQFNAPLDQDLPMPAMVQHAFHLYDGLAGQIGAVTHSEDGEDFTPESGDHPNTNGGGGEDARDNVPWVSEDQGNYGDYNIPANSRPRTPPPDVNTGEDPVDDDIAAMENEFVAELELLEESARTPLFAGAKLTQLSSTLLILNCLRTHGASNALVNELFLLLRNSVLPSVNSLPTSEYSASKLLKQLGLAYNLIHVCPGPKACMLFRGENSELQQCTVCGAERYRRVGKSKVPAKVLRHFPLIPRLERMYSTPVQAFFMTSHARLASTDDGMRGAYDSHQWKFINWRWWEEFAKEDRNIRLGLATDGVNPFSVKRSTHSTWPVLLMNYNLPPWMVTKKHFIMLSLLIPGKKSVTGENFDVYMQPLLEELQVLWSRGVQTEDAARYGGSRVFNLKAMLMWTCHDFPAYGVVAGCVTKGYKGCPICAKNTVSRRSTALKKSVYDNQYRRWLPADHPWRTNRAAFNGEVELRGPPDPITVQETLRWGRLREAFVMRGSTPIAEDPAREYGVKRVSCLFSLPYWEELPIRNTLDVMHIERNISDNVLKHLFGEKDTPALRRDMEEAGRMPDLHLIPTESGDFIKPRAPYVFTNSEKQKFISLVSSTRVPSGYSSTLIKHVGELRLSGLKSHDHHILLQEILPAAVRHSLTKGVRETIIRIGKLFKKICAKVIFKSELPSLYTDAAETLCMLEMFFPPGFFDVMPHLIVHLVREIEICGPVQSRWCYFVERYLGQLVKYVRDTSKPEAGMASGYMIDESLGFVTEYFSLFKHTRRRVWDPEEELRDAGELLCGNPKQKRLSAEDLHHVHEYVLKHSVFTAELLQAWEEEKVQWQRSREQFRRSSRARRHRHQQFQYPDELAAPFPSFATWINRRVRSLRQENFPMSDELLELHCPPSNIALSFPAMWAYGCHFRCQDRGVDPYVSFDSGIATVTPDSSTLDVGILKAILLVTYGKLSCVLMRGEWMKSNDQGRATVRKDRMGFWSVLYDARDAGPRHNPYVFPKTVSQVYFMEDGVNPSWKVVILHEPRSRRVTEEKEFVDIDSAGEIFPLPTGTGNPDEGTSSNTGNPVGEGEVLPAACVAPLVREGIADTEDAVFEDDDYEDEMEIQYVE